MPKKKPMKRDLDQLLQDISVVEVDAEVNEANGGELTAILGWWGVVADDGITAYFSTENEAFRYRLDLINRIMNPDRKPNAR